MADALRGALPRFPSVEWLARTGSTNADLLARARQPRGRCDRPWLLGCHLQTRGRGRADRVWQNHAGTSLMFSCAFDTSLPLRQLPALSPLLGLAACEALRALLSPGLRPHLEMKWPNDLQWREAKLAGILIESVRPGAPCGAEHRVIVIGMGLNLQDAPALSAALDRPVADWAGIVCADPTAGIAAIPTLVGNVARGWLLALDRAAAEGFADLPHRYARADALKGRAVDVLGDGRPLDSGTGCGIDPSGRLLLRTALGTHALSAGEVSVRVRS